jgi:DNA-binding beta-propeller fold protein YncE
VKSGTVTSTLWKRLIATACVALLAGVIVAAPASGATSPTKSVLFVGNNWGGTAHVLDPHRRSGFKRLAELNIIPDKAERDLEIASNPDKAAFFIAIQQGVGEGNNQYVDDMYSSRDGRLLIVSRPSYADVVAIEIKTGEIAWRFPMEGYRSDHMGLSPDGKHIAVSDNTANKVHILEVQTGQEVGSFPSGDTPHENTYSKDGSKIYHASIGRVYLPTDQPEFDTTKGDRRFQIVDTSTNQIIMQRDMGQKLEEAGYPNMDSAVRPMALSPSEGKVYFQVSFFHGFVEYDFSEDRVTRVATLPNLVPDLPREQYLLDSAHHGIAMNPEGTKLCVAGTMSDYGSIVSRRTFNHELVFGGEKPYWSTNNGTGHYCFISWSGSDRISALSYKTGEEVDRTTVGNHPQRMRMGKVRRSWLASLP